MGFSELLSRRSVDLRSRGVWPALLTGLAFVASAAVTGCVIVDDHHDGSWDDTTVYEPPPPDDTAPILATIDADATIDASPGEGAGLFIEYTAGGSWRTWTTCDTNYSGYDCGFEVCVLNVDGTSVRSAEADSNEADDSISTYGDGYTCLTARTADDTDGMRFQTDAGATLRVELFLDGVAEPRFMYWVGDGARHKGAPRDPLDLVPASP